VRFLGARSDMPDVYPAADGLLLPTRYDPCANACLEAAACGLPVVSSAHNGAMEWVDDGGVVVSQTLDPAAWARALDALARPEARAALSMRARKRAVLNDWTSHAERLRDLYADVVDQRSGGTGGERA
jgi:UDP-glucose:(heptosyl)LPS alpha-1,3-glucosyltransferase